MHHFYGSGEVLRLSAVKRAGKEIIKLLRLKIAFQKIKMFGKIIME